MRLQWHPKAKPASTQAGCSAPRPATAVIAHETAVSAASGGMYTVLRSAHATLTRLFYIVTSPWHALSAHRLYRTAQGGRRAIGSA